MEYDTPYLNELRDRGITLPAILCQIRTDLGREKRKQGIEVFRYKFLTPRADRICNTLTGVTKDNLIMIKTNNNMELTYHEHPTKEDLLQYFGQRIKVRKMHENEAGRLMGLEDADIEKINAYPFKTMTERETALANADKKELNRIKRESVSKTAKYKCYGNSIVVNVLVHLFRTMLIPDQPENKITRPTPYSQSLNDKLHTK